MFNERLQERMKQKNISTNELAKRLYNYGSSSDLWEIYDNKGREKRKVQKWIKGDTKPKSIDELRKICDILDCDSSYLIGDSPIANVNNKKVAEWIGLDEISISKIKNYNVEVKLFMSLLIRANEYNNKFGDILHEFIEKMLFLSQNSSHTSVTIENDLLKEKECLKGEAAFNFILSTIQTMMEPIFYEVAILGMDINDKKYKIESKKREAEHKKKIESLLSDISKTTGKSKEEILEDIEKHKTK